MQDANTLYRVAARSARSRSRNRLGRALPRDLQSRRSAEVVSTGPQGGKPTGPRRTSASRARSRARIRRRPRPRPRRRSRSTPSSPMRISSSPELELDNTRYDAARERIDRVLKTNPSHLDARALLGAIAYVRDDKAAFEAEVARVLAINPTFGEVYRVAGELAARHYRFDEAVALTRRAIELSPSNIRAQSDLGLHLMRTGDEAEARRVLDAHVQGVPVRPGDLQPARAPRQAREVRGRAGRRPDLQVRSRRGEGPARVRDPARAGRAQEAVGVVPVHAEGADPHRDLPGSRRLRGPQPRPARARRRARRVLRPRRQHGLAAGQGAGHLLVAGDALARARARRHAADVEPARAALADRRAFRSTKRAARGRRGATRWRCRSRSRSSAGRC